MIESYQLKFNWRWLQKPGAQNGVIDFMISGYKFTLPVNKYNVLDTVEWRQKEMRGWTEVRERREMRTHRSLDVLVSIT